MKEAGLSNWSKINPLAIDTDFSVPYRGSQVLLAYDTTKLDPADAPKTFADLIAWIKANPGQFIYNRPDKGGSGGNFVRRAIYEANGNDPADVHRRQLHPEFAEEALAPAWAILQDLAPSLFDEGAYTSGNTQSLQLLGQSAVTMIPAWSDQAMQAIATGVLPETTGLVQLTDLGAARRLLAQRRARERRQQGRGAEARRLHPDRGDPERGAHRARRLPRRLLGLRLARSCARSTRTSSPTTIPIFPGGDWEVAINDGWYRNVAPNVDRSQ